MSEKSDDAVLYTAVYQDVDAALADMSAFEKLRKADMVGHYDAAVIDKEDGKPHIVKRADSPAYRVIPEWLGGGTLSRDELHEAAGALDSDEAALIVVGEPTLEKGFTKAVTRATKTARQNLAADLEKALSGTSKK